MEVSEAKRLRELARENAGLEKMMAQQALDIRMLKDVNGRKWCAWQSSDAQCACRPPKVIVRTIAG